MQQSTLFALLVQHLFSYFVISFNLHGLNNGRSFWLISVIVIYTVVNIMIEHEYSLTPNNLSLLHDIHPDFDYFDVSAMGEKLSTGLFKGRPLGCCLLLAEKFI